MQDEVDSIYLFAVLRESEYTVGKIDLRYFFLSLN